MTRELVLIVAMRRNFAVIFVILAVFLLGEVAECGGERLMLLDVARLKIILRLLLLY